MAAGLVVLQPMGAGVVRTACEWCGCAKRPGAACRHPGCPSEYDAIRFRRWPLRVLREEPNPWPNYTAALRTVLLQSEAMKHRTRRKKLK